MFKTLLEYLKFLIRPAQSPEPSILVLDPGLRNNTGHHLNVSQSLAEIVASMGFWPVILGNQQNKSDGREQYKVTPFFESQTYLPLYRIYNGNKGLGTKQEQDEFKEELIRVYREYPMPKKLLIFPTVLSFQLSALASWIIENGNPQRTPIIAWLLFDSTFMTRTEEQAKWAHEEYRIAFGMLGEASIKTGQKLLFVCETSKMVEYVSQLTHLPVEKLRLPNLAMNKSTSINRSPLRNGKLTILFAGHANREKGTHHLPCIISEILSRQPDVQFRVHLLLEDTNAVFHDVETQLLGMGSAVEVITGPLIPQEFHALVASADIMLMPYDPEAYRNRGSAVFHEAMTFGIPMVLPSAASFALEAIENGIAVGFEEYSAKSISKALEAAIADYPALKNNAVRVADEIGLHHQKVSSLMEKVMKNSCEGV